MRLKYIIDGNNSYVDVHDNTQFTNGENICLADKFSDITNNQEWYNLGYGLINTKKILDLKEIKNSLQKLIYKMIHEYNKDISKDEFTLEKYHRFVDKNLHMEIIKKN